MKHPESESNDNTKPAGNTNGKKVWLTPNGTVDANPKKSTEKTDLDRLREQYEQVDIDSRNTGNFGPGF